MNHDVDKFIKSLKQWQVEATALRAILLKTKLNEDLKWRLPCYSHEGANIVIIQPFKACLALMFFKGMFLKDPKRALVNNGPNSRSAKRLEFRSVDDVKKISTTIKAYVKEAIALEASQEAIGKSALVRKTEPLPTELKSAFSKDKKLAAAFRALTPGRQRAYILHFGSAKQVATREARIKKLTPKILKGKGLQD